jgi:hypothetical protein
MKLAIMQPYLFPYLGYFQLINAVDKFVIYDNIQYSKRGWINRNRILQNGMDKLFTLPLKKDSDYLNVSERYLANNSIDARKKILRQIMHCYKRAPYFESVSPIIEKCFRHDDVNLFNFILNTVTSIVQNLFIRTPVINSSSINYESNLKGEKKVLAICKAMKADHYINAIGGIGLYDKEEFSSHGIQLTFLKTKPIEYKQFEHSFVPSLSIIDVLMFNSIEEIQDLLKDYSLL